MKIYLVRHGRTLFNQKKVWQGWCDAPLLKKDGEELSYALGAGLRDVPFAAVYSSPLGRAYETARWILKGYGKDLPIEVNRNLIEMHFGSLEGDPVDPALHARFFEGYERFGGDSVETLTNRIKAGIREIADAHPQGNVLAVSHGWAIRCALRSIDQEGIDALYAGGFRSANCSVSILDYTDGKWTIESIFDKQYTEKGQKLLQEASK